MIVPVHLFLKCARILYQFVVTMAYSRAKLSFQNPFVSDQPLLFISSLNTTKNQKGEAHEIYFFNPILKIIRKFSQWQFLKF